MWQRFEPRDAIRHSRRYPQIRSRRGVTLIELIAILGIAVLIIFLLFPPQSPESDEITRKANKNEATCMENLRLLGRAIMLYAQDYDNTYPTTVEKTFDPHGDPPLGTTGYLGPLRKYLTNTTMLHCPSAVKPGVSYAVNGSRIKKYDGYDSVWGLKGWWGKYLFYSYPAKKSQVLSPANVILAFDCASPHLCSMDTTLGDVNSGWYGGFFGQFDIDRKPVKPLHNNGMNFLFCDGHVGWFSVVGHPGWDAPTGYIHPPKPRENDKCLAGGRRPSIDISMADWPAQKISFRRDYKP